MSILDNSTNSLLAEAGINQSERQVYQAGLGATYTSAELLKRVDMPRPTLMAALAALREYGLCDVRKLDGRSYSYSMQPINSLKPFLGKQLRSLDSLMDRLDAHQEPTQQVVVQEATGQAALQDMLELALRCQSRTWQIIAPRDNALSYLPANYVAYFKRVRNERQIQAETLWEPKASGQDVPLHDVLMRKPRYVSSKLTTTIPLMIISFDDSVLIIDGTTQPHAVLIRGESMAKTFQLLFEMAWRFAR